ncbi:hypothetical protein TWF718_007812 [Orbilia javanica]|uniref:Uncharacterized protein n=1 Tax=Orbilia javanica TaxID=47235 RepID=A0AAN8MPH3_9PEZI
MQPSKSDKEGSPPSSPNPHPEVPRRLQPSRTNRRALSETGLAGLARRASLTDIEERVLQESWSQSQSPTPSPNRTSNAGAPLAQPISLYGLRAFLPIPSCLLSRIRPAGDPDINTKEGSDSSISSSWTEGWISSEDFDTEDSDTEMSGRRRNRSNTNAPPPSAGLAGGSSPLATVAEASAAEESGDEVAQPPEAPGPSTATAAPRALPYRPTEEDESDDLYSSPVFSSTIGNVGSAAASSPSTFRKPEGQGARSSPQPRPSRPTERAQPSPAVPPTRPPRSASRSPVGQRARSPSPSPGLSEEAGAATPLPIPIPPRPPHIPLSRLNRPHFIPDDGNEGSGRQRRRSHDDGSEIESDLGSAHTDDGEELEDLREIERQQRKRRQHIAPDPPPRPRYLTNVPEMVTPIVPVPVPPAEGPRYRRTPGDAPHQRSSGSGRINRPPSPMSLLTDIIMNAGRRALGDERGGADAAPSDGVEPGLSEGLPPSQRRNKNQPGSGSGRFDISNPAHVTARRIRSMQNPEFDRAWGGFGRSTGNLWDTLDPYPPSGHYHHILPNQEEEPARGSDEDIERFMRSFVGEDIKSPPPGGQKVLRWQMAKVNSVMRQWFAKFEVRPAGKWVLKHQWAGCWVTLDQRKGRWYKLPMEDHKGPGATSTGGRWPGVECLGGEGIRETVGRRIRFWGENFEAVRIRELKEKKEVEKQAADLLREEAQRIKRSEEIDKLRREALKRRGIDPDNLDGDSDDDDDDEQDNSPEKSGKLPTRKEGTVEAKPKKTTRTPGSWEAPTEASKTREASRRKDAEAASSSAPGSPSGGFGSSKAKGKAKTAAEDHCEARKKETRSRPSLSLKPSTPPSRPVSSGRSTTGLSYASAAAPAPPAGSSSSVPSSPSSRAKGKEVVRDWGSEDETKKENKGG